VSLNHMPDYTLRYRSPVFDTGIVGFSILSMEWSIYASGIIFTSNALSSM